MKRFKFDNIVMLNYIFLLTAFCGIAGFTYSQNCTIKSGFAYERTTLPGTIPKNDLDENGNQVARPAKNMNTYFIYIETKLGCDIQVVTVWIGGKAYRVTQEEITTKPVVIHHSHPGTPPDTLVNKTHNKITRLQITEALAISPGKKAAQKIASSKILIECTKNSKTDYFAIKDIKRIAPLVLQ